MCSAARTGRLRSWRAERGAQVRLRGLLLGFQPLLLSWFGKGEVSVPCTAQSGRADSPICRDALMCGFYLNELLVNLLARDDPHERLFDYYRATLQRLADQNDHAATLRALKTSASGVGLCAGA